MSTRETTKKLYRDLTQYGFQNQRHVGSWAMEEEGEMRMTELHNYTMTVTDPNECILPYGSGHVGIITEFFDIVLGLNPGFVHKQWPFYAAWLEDGVYPYTYGEIIKKQWKLTFNKLKEHPGTRHATMYCWDQSCHERDFVPCTHTFHFQFIDDKLCLTVTMRSQDAVKGWYLDSFLYCHLLCIMAKQLGVPVGHYTIFQHNIHVYPDDIKTMEKRLKDCSSSGPKHCEIPVLEDKDYEALHDALTYVYEETSLYMSDPLDNIESDYYRSLMALIFAYRWPETPKSYMVSEALEAWYEKVIE